MEAVKTRQLEHCVKFQDEGYDRQECFSAPVKLPDFAWDFYSYYFQPSCSSLKPFSSVVSFYLSLLFPLLQFYWLLLSYPGLPLLFKSFTLILQFTTSLYPEDSSLLTFLLPNSFRCYLKNSVISYEKTLISAGLNISVLINIYLVVAQDQFSTSREKQI